MRKNNAGQKTMRLMPLLFLMQLLCLVSVAQVSISGKVTGKNGAGIPDVSVQVRNSSAGAVTDAGGNYSFTADLAPGNYFLVFSGVGFKQREAALTVGTDKSYSVNAEMVSDVMGLEEVVITGASIGTTRKQLGSYI